MIVVGKRRHPNGEDDRLRRDATEREALPAARQSIAQPAPRDPAAGSETEDKPFEWSRDGEQHRPRRHRRSVAGLQSMRHAERGAEDQRAPPAGERSPPVRLAPGNLNRGMQRVDQSPHRGPAGRGPAEQHPIDRHRRERRQQPDAGQRLAGGQLPQCQKRPLAGRVLRRVRRLMDHVERLKMFPVRMRRVRDAAVAERVGGEQVAELVVNRRQRPAYQRQQHSLSEDERAERCRHQPRTAEHGRQPRRTSPPRQGRFRRCWRGNGHGSGRPLQRGFSASVRYCPPSGRR